MEMMMEEQDVRVLLVEDDDDDYVLLRDLMGQIFGPTCDLDWVSGYEAALERVREREYDVCLLDYRLGERNGLELLGHLQQIRASTGSHGPDLRADM